MTDELTARATAALEGTTDGPWTLDSEDQGCWGLNYSVLQDGNLMLEIAEMVAEEADAAFIAASRQLVPDLLSEVERLCDENKALTARAEAAEANARQEGWHSGIEAAAKVARDCIYYDSAGIGFDDDKFDAAIRALAEKGPTDE